MANQYYAKYGMKVRIDKVVRASWGTEIRVTNVDSPDMKPQSMMLNVSKKGEEKVPQDLRKGDIANVEFSPMLVEGVSEKTRKAYSINKLYLTDISVQERGPVEIDEDKDPDADMPF